MNHKNPLMSLLISPFPVFLTSKSCMNLLPSLLAGFSSFPRPTPSSLQTTARGTGLKWKCDAIRWHKLLQWTPAILKVKPQFCLWLVRLRMTRPLLTSLTLFSSSFSQSPWAEATSTTFVSWNTLSGRQQWAKDVSLFLNHSQIFLGSNTRTVMVLELEGQSWKGQPFCGWQKEHDLGQGEPGGVGSHLRGNMTQTSAFKTTCWTSLVVCGWQPTCQCRGWSRRIPHATGQLSPRAATTEAWVPWAYVWQQKKAPQWEACSLQPERSPHLLQLEKARMQQRRPSAAENLKKNF